MGANLHFELEVRNSRYGWYYLPKDSYEEIIIPSSAMFIFGYEGYNYAKVKPILSTEGKKWHEIEMTDYLRNSIKNYCFEGTYSYIYDGPVFCSYSESDHYHWGSFPAYDLLKLRDKKIEYDPIEEIEEAVWDDEYKQRILEERKKYINSDGENKTLYEFYPALFEWLKLLLIAFENEIRIIYFVVS